MIKKTIIRLEHKSLYFYVFFCLLLLHITSYFLDLPLIIGNWEDKSWSILNFTLNDNYYPPGASLALIPFLWNGPDFWLAIYFYYAVSAIIYFKICSYINLGRGKIVALVALPLNFYLTWLCLTSADQVVELTFLLSLGYSAIKSKFYLSLVYGFLLCFTRPSYWPAYMLIIYFLAKNASKEQEYKSNLVKKGAAIWVLFGVLTFNQVVFSSTNLSSSSQDTLFYSHQKFHYLTLPKFDMDVFLQNGASTNYIQVTKKSDKFDFIDDLKLRAVLVSIFENPHRFIFSEIQKFDSHFFTIQKVPNLPGDYQLSPDENSIKIGNERLTWSLTFGYLLYAIYRAIWMLLFSIVILWVSLLVWNKLRLKPFEKYLPIPYLLGIIPGLIFYSETRFKICSELLIVPLGMFAFKNIKKLVILNNSRAEGKSN
jgi:hypothetical protein